MLFEVIFINKENHLKKFITSGENEEKCKELAKRYINKKGGAIGPARMNKIKKVDRLNNFDAIEVKKMIGDKDFSFLDANTIKHGNTITFICGNKEMIRLKANGDIFVKGVLAENNIDVVEGIKDFLRGHKYLI